MVEAGLHLAGRWTSAITGDSLQARQPSGVTGRLLPSITHADHRIGEASIVPLGPSVPLGHGGLCPQGALRWLLADIGLFAAGSSRSVQGRGQEDFFDDEDPFKELIEWLTAECMQEESHLEEQALRVSGARLQLQEADDPTVRVARSCGHI